MSDEDEIQPKDDELDPKIMESEDDEHADAEQPVVTGELGEPAEPADESLDALADEELDEDEDEFNDVEADEAV